MALPNAADIQKSVLRLAGYYTFTVPVAGALAAQDYLGDTTNDEGQPMPQGTLEAVRVNLSSTDDGNTDVQLENETTGTTHSYTLGTSAYEEETGIGLYFSEGDELSVAVTSVTTPGDAIGITLLHEVAPAPMN